MTKPKLLLPSMKGWEAVVGEHPKLTREKEGKQERIYFPHVTIPGQRRGWHDQLTINSGGWPMENHDAHALLIANASALLKVAARAWIAAHVAGKTVEADAILNTIMEARGFANPTVTYQAILDAERKGQLK